MFPSWRTVLAAVALLAAFWTFGALLVVRS